MESVIRRFIIRRRRFLSLLTSSSYVSTRLNVEKDLAEVSSTSIVAYVLLLCNLPSEILRNTYMVGLLSPKLFLGNVKLANFPWLKTVFRAVDQQSRKLKIPWQKELLSPRNNGIGPNIQPWVGVRISEGRLRSNMAPLCKLRESKESYVRS